MIVGKIGDFGVGNIFTVQDHNTALTGLNFAIDGGDYHISLDRISQGRFRASDLRLRFEASPPTLLDSLSLRADQVRMGDHPVEIQLDMLHAEFGPFPLQIEKGRDENHCWVDWIIYRGEERDFDLVIINSVIQCFTRFAVFPQP